MSRPGPRTIQSLLTVGVAVLLAGVVIAFFIGDRDTRLVFAAPLALALAVVAGLAIDRWFRARREQRLAERRVDTVRSDGEAKFRALAESVPGVTLLRDSDGGSLLYASPQIEALLGYTVAEWKGQPDLLAGLLHPDDRERVLAELESAPSDGRPFRSSYRLVARDGHVVGVREATTTVRGAAGGPLYTQTVLLDDAERRRAAEERDRLRGAERDAATHTVVLQGRLDLLRDASELLASSVDVRASLREVSNLVVRDFADWCTVDVIEDDGELVRAAAAAGKRSAQLAREPGESVRRVVQSGQKLLLTSLAGNGARQEEFPPDAASLVSVAIRGRGRPLGVLTCGRLTPGPPYAADDAALAEDLAAKVGVAIDRARLYREVEERADAGRVLTYVADGVLLVDRDGVVRLWNPAAERITGIGASELVGHAAADRIGGWRDALESVPVASSPDPGHPEVIVPIESRDGERWISIAGVQFFDGTVYAFRDVTEVRRLEELKADFIATASHELRTPLAAVYGAAQTLLRHDFALDEAGRDRFISLIADESDRLGRIVNEILLANQLDAGRVDLGTDAFDPVELVERVVDAARVHAPPNIVLDRVVPTEVPHVAADRDKVRQVLVNLVENAIKYSPGGGRIEVGLEPGREPGAERVVFFVRDEGLGIPRDEQARIFEKFYRLDPHMTRGVGGTGLGLYICSELVNRMGGHIWVESTEGEGSTFMLELPAEAPLRARPTPIIARTAEG